MVEFGNKVLIIGYGSVSRCTIPILLKHVKIPYKNITVIDFADMRKDIKIWTDRGVKYYQVKITPLNITKEQPDEYCIQAICKSPCKCKKRN